MLLFKKKVHTIKAKQKKWRSGLLSGVMLVTSVYALPPEIVSAGPTSATVNVMYKYQVIAKDPEGGPFRYALQSAPKSMKISKTGLITWTPTASQKGKNTVKIRILDDEDLREYQFVYIDVATPSPDIIPNNNQSPSEPVKPIAKPAETVTNTANAKKTQNPTSTENEPNQNTNNKELSIKKTLSINEDEDKIEKPSPKNVEPKKDTINETIATKDKAATNITPTDIVPTEIASTNIETTVADNPTQKKDIKITPEKPLLKDNSSKSKREEIDQPDSNKTVKPKDIAVASNKTNTIESSVTLSNSASQEPAKLPIAVSQNIVIVENTGTSISLQAEGSDSKTFNYSIIESVSSGAITGDLPNLTYMPSSNFSGTDKLTFTVQSADGLTSRPASVNITILNDLDGDGIADINDKDRDGDAVNNEDELAHGTDPDNDAEYIDTVTPSLTINNPISSTTYEDYITITGKVSDSVQHQSGMKQVLVKSDRFEKNTFEAIITGETFSVEIPLRRNINKITIAATDASGNSVTDNVIVERQYPPQFSNITPDNGSVVSSDTVTISGELHTQLPLSDVTFLINQWKVSPEKNRENGVYPFTVGNIPLKFGINKFVLSSQTKGGNHSQTLTINHAPEDFENIPSPEISVQYPAEGSQVTSNRVNLTAEVVSYGGPLSIQINGVDIALSNSSSTRAKFTHLARFDEGVNTLDLTIAATDSLGKVTTKTVQYYRDAVAPVITLDNLIASPTLNTIKTAPYSIKGNVVDTDLDSVIVNGESVTLVPGAGEGSFEFSVVIAVGGGETVPINITAKDFSGNETAAEYVVKNTSLSEVKLLSPSNGTEMVSNGEPISFQVIAQLDQLQAGETVKMSLDGGSFAPLAITGSMAIGYVDSSLAKGEHTVYIELRNSSGQKIASTESAFSVVSVNEIPIQLSRVEPLANQQFVEPNQAIELHFNKIIELSELNLSVKETLHGKTYIDTDEQGHDFVHSVGYQLNEVHREAEQLSGSLALMPGGTSAVFYPNRHFGFGSEVTVDVEYDGEELSQSTFTVRSLPTFIRGTVNDQFGQPLAGLVVSLPALNRKTITNTDGGFAFGYQEGGDKIIPGGKYQLLINDQLGNATFGMGNHTIEVTQHQRNNLGNYTLAELNRNISFEKVVSGENNNLAGDDLILDLTNAEAIFADGKTTGRVHTQFLPFEHLGVDTWPQAIPLWMFSNQPKGITLKGDVGLSIKIPKLSGSYDYLPDVYQYVMLVAYNPEAEIVEPIGIGQIKNHRVESVGAISIKNLDYVGYAVVDLLYQNLLEAVAKGEQPLRSLTAILQ